MRLEELLGGLALLGLFGLILYFPIRFFVLIGQVKSLEQRLKTLASRTAASSATPVEAPAASIASSPCVPPPLPVKPTQTAAPALAAPVQPDPLLGRLRDLGLLPPTDLKGEYALGAWWAVRVGGLLRSE
jgi:uncharacterized membrane protein